MSFALGVAVSGCGSESLTPGLIERCSGTYLCSFPDGTKAEGALAKKEGKCTFDTDTVLAESGKVYAGDQLSTLTWSGDSANFEICGPGGCAKCAEQPSKGKASGSGASGAKQCTGVPVRCSSLRAGTCVLDGCSFESRVTFNGSFENECTGTARACASYTSEGLCTGQTGCSWE